MHLPHNKGAGDNNCGDLKMDDYDWILRLKWLVKYMDKAMKGNDHDKCQRRREDDVFSAV